MSCGGSKHTNVNAAVISQVCAEHPEVSVDDGRKLFHALADEYHTAAVAEFTEITGHAPKTAAEKAEVTQIAHQKARWALPQRIAELPGPADNAEPGPADMSASGDISQWTPPPGLNDSIPKQYIGMSAYADAQFITKEFGDDFIGVPGLPYWDPLGVPNHIGQVQSPPSFGVSDPMPMPNGHALTVDNQTGVPMRVSPAAMANAMDATGASGDVRLVLVPADQNPGTYGGYQGTSVEGQHVVVVALKDKDHYSPRACYVVNNTALYGLRTAALIQNAQAEGEGFIETGDLPYYGRLADPTGKKEIPPYVGEAQGAAVWALLPPKGN